MNTRSILVTFLLVIGSFRFVRAQSYHTPLKADSIQQMNAMLDSLETPRLRVSVHQPDKAQMKFRVSFFNPTGRRATITIRRKDDIFFYENISGTEFASLYDFNQMEDGDYQVVVVGGKEKATARISIRTETKVCREVTLQ